MSDNQLVNKKDLLDAASVAREILKMVRRAEARAALERARLERPGAVTRVQRVLSESVTQAREHIRLLIRERFAGDAQMAYFRKLESTSDTDLASLLDDLGALDHLDNDDQGTS